MTDRPILFSAPMIRALLNGSKTQTRRVVISPDKPLYKPALNPIFDLWVRETWRTKSDCYDDLSPSQLSGEETILYNADTNWSENNTIGRTRASIHMPRWASRLTLIVTDVRVERLQDISVDDAIDEGPELDFECCGNPEIEYDDNGPCGYGPCCGNPNLVTDPRQSFRTLWDSINGKTPGKVWADNPWVVALSFDMQKRNIDEGPHD